ncbi:DNA-methyltransferase [Nocardioides aquiterrae]|uniref:Methyltransferase n=1 Tax=Nocardioides aquiterrae TaxID=203799 RepID=A0ABP4F0J5_9ACTN
MAGVLKQQITDRYAIYNADCMDVLAALPADSIHAAIYSPPFGGLYQYSSDDRDLSNARSYDEFFTMYGFVVDELYRVTIPGRTVAVHAALVPSGNTGRDAYTDFPGDVIRAHQARGWAFIARHVIWKEPLGVRLRTMAKNLAHKTIVDDAALGGVAAPDELLIFRKPGASEPVHHPAGLTGIYAGSEEPPADLEPYRGWTGDQKENRWSHWIWRRYASSVWDDVRIDRVLPFQDAKDEDDEKHVHPLQLDVIERFIDLRTLPGERVLTPFMGVGSEVYTAVRMGRYGIGAELKPSYYVQAERNMATVDALDATSSPLDLAGGA